MAPIFFWLKRDQGFATGVPNIVDDGVHKSTPLSAIAIAGIVFAGVLGIIAIVWAGIWYYKLRRAERAVRSISPSYAEKIASNSTTSLTEESKGLPQLRRLLCAYYTILLTKGNYLVTSRHYRERWPPEAN